MEHIESIREGIKQRAKHLFNDELIEALGLDNFYIAGNALNQGKPADLDLFPVRETDFIERAPAIEAATVSETRNACTAIVNGVTVQLCNYYHESLAELVESFDFAHVKLGAKVEVMHGTPFVTDVYYSEDWLAAKALESTFYTGSGYPLSSLIRCFKYSTRGDFSRSKYVNSIIKIVEDIVTRGFSDYEDFKDQLDAVDLGLALEEIDGLNQCALLNIFQTLQKDAKGGDK